MKKLLFALLIPGFFPACTPETMVAHVERDSLPCEESVIVDKDLFAHAPDDEFVLSQAAIDGDCLNLTIGYGGGCDEVTLKLIDAEAVLQSQPVQRKIRLSLEDHDHCEAFLTRELSFDLTPLRISNDTQVSLQLQGWDKALLYTY